MLIRDTAPEVRACQFQVYRSMSPAERLEVALTLSEDVRQVALDGIRMRHPKFAEAHVRHEFLRILHGDELAARLMSHPLR